MINQSSTVYRLLTIVIALITAQGLTAQFGLRAKYNLNTYSDWQDIPDIDQPNLELGLDYWFKLKNHRVEFMPELYYGLNSSTTYSLPSSRDITTSHTYAGLQFNTHLYILDFIGDCDCPTFSKEGPGIKKGFFFNVAPGVVYNQYSRTAEITGTPDPEASAVNVRVAVGAGVDIGITDLLTITPMVHYVYSPSNDADFRTFENEIITSPWSSLQFGLRVGLRPDYVNQYGRR